MFLLPKQTIYEVEKKIKQFLWAGNIEVHRSHKVTWPVVCLPKMEGGLGLLDLKLWNKVLIGINYTSSSLWSNWINNTKCKGTSIIQLDIKGSVAWSWRGFLKLRPTLTLVISSSMYYYTEIYDKLKQVGSIVE